MFAEDLPLDGIRVIDMTRVLAGPLSTMVLGDLGADVIKVEHPVRGDDTRDWGIQIAPKDTTYFYGFNRNKRSVALDLTSLEGQEAIRALVRDADVFVENFVAGKMEEFGLGYEELKKINPKIVYCAVSGYDRLGPERARPGYDLVVQGESGLMSINGEADQPPLKFGVAAVDLTTGMYAAQAILAALLKVARKGTGTRIDLSLYDCGVMFASYYGLDALRLGHDPQRFGNQHPAIMPYGVYEAADGPLIVAVGNNNQFFTFCRKVIDRPDLADDPRFATNLLRGENRAALAGHLRDEIARRPRAELLARLEAAGIPSGSVLGIHAALTNERTEKAELIRTIEHPTAGPVQMMGPPWRLDGKRLATRRPPMLGEDTDDVLGNLSAAIPSA